MTSLHHYTTADLVTNFASLTRGGVRGNKYVTRRKKEGPKILVLFAFLLLLGWFCVPDSDKGFSGMPEQA